MENTKPAKKKDNTLTFIQVVCAFAVITLHTNGAFWNFSATERYWVTANIIESVCFFAVPIFFMISGITLMNYQDKYSTKEYFHKRITKTLIPYIIWSIIGVAYLHLMNYQWAEMDIRWFIYGLLNGKIISIYWFFPPLFCIYLSMPMFAAIDKNKKEWVLKYLLAVGILVNTLAPFIIKVMGEDILWPYNVSVVTGYLIWVVVGYVLYKYPPKLKTKCAIYTLAVVGLLLHICGTYILSMRDGQINSTYKGYNNLPSFMYSVGVFLFLTDIGKRLMTNKKVEKVICYIGKYTFAIYLMHWFVMNFITVKFQIDTLSIWWRLGAPIPIGLIVIAITWLIRKIPIVRNIVP